MESREWKMDKAKTEQNLVQMFYNQVLKYGDRVALKMKREGRYQDISWNQFAKSVEVIAAALLERGIEKGDRVAILSENRPEWVYTDLAILSVGAVTVPIYATNPAAQVNAILKDSQAAAIVVSNQEQLQKVGAAIQVFTFEELLRRGGPCARPNTGQSRGVAPTLNQDSLATLIYTSGTTGEPKGVMLTHGNFLSNCQACAQVIPINDQDIYLSFLPLSHVFERLAGYYLMIHQGATIAYAENMETVPQNMMEVQPTVMCGVPRFFEKLHAKVMESVQQSTGLKRKIAEWAFELARRGGPMHLSVGAGPCARPNNVGQPQGVAPTLSYKIANLLVFRKLRSKLGGRLRFFVSGSAPLAKEIAEFFYGVGILILEGYGLTETSPVISCNRLDRFRFGTVGLPVPGVEVKIAPDGEILTRGPHVMKGYYKMETATKEVLTDDGWFHTGDIGGFDADGFLRITDRKKDLIITSGGKNVAPQKIENLLKQSSYILDAMLYGDRKKYLTCLIVPNIPKIEAYAQKSGVRWNNAQELLSLPETRRLIHQQIDLQSKELAPYEQIKYFVLLDKPLTQEAGELTPTLKIRRKIVTEKYRDLLEKLYEMQ